MIFLTSVKDIKKTKESLKNCHSKEQTIETAVGCGVGSGVGFVEKLVKPKQSP